MDLGFILAGMTEKNPRHNALSFLGFVAAFSRVLAAVP
jgi:hypothetical protein